MPWQNPIIDRTAQDVAFADSHRWLPEPNRGARNFRDFARIYGNLNEIVRELNLRRHFPEPFIGDITKWLNNYVPRYSEVDIVRQDVAYIRQFASDLGFVHEDTPQVPELPWTSFQKMNDVEKVILDIYEIVISIFTKTTKTYLVTGMAYTGGEGGLRATERERQKSYYFTGMAYVGMNGGIRIAR